MSDKEETTTNETQEQEEQQIESVENFGDVVETQEPEVISGVESVKKVAIDIDRIEEDGSPEEIQKIEDVSKETIEEAEDAREEYEEQIKSIPNFDDKVEAIEKEVGENNSEDSEKVDYREEQESRNLKTVIIGLNFEVDSCETVEDLNDVKARLDNLGEEYNDNSELQEVSSRISDKMEKINRIDLENEDDGNIKVDEESLTETEVETAEKSENERSCPKCGALFPGTANFCGKCGTELGEGETKEAEDVKEVPETQQSETKETKDEQLFDRLSEINVSSIKAINMEDQELAIRKIDDALLDLDLFIVDNQKAIGNNQGLETIVNAVRDSLGEARNIIEERGGDGAQEIKEDVGTFTENTDIKKDEKPEEIEEKSPVEDYQYTYDRVVKDIEDVLSSNKDPYEKRNDLDHVEKILKSSHDDFIPDNILENEDVREMTKDLKNKFNIARSKIEESKTEKEKKADAEIGVDFVVQNVSKSLDFKTSEESPSGKTSALIFASGSLDDTYKKYKDIIDSDEKLKIKLNNAIKRVKTALEEQEKLQAKNDRSAT